MDVSIIIVNYNTSRHLRKCLSSIYFYIKKIEWEVLVVDNNSPDRSIEKLCEEFPMVKFYYRNVNDGFGAGCNFAVKCSKGKYVYFVNPDITFINNAVYEFFKFMEEHTDVGICSGLLIDANGELLYTYNYFPSISWEFSLAISRRYDEKINELFNYALINEKYKKEFEVDWLVGASMFVRVSYFKMIKGFDANIFLYYEDVDLSFRLREIKKRVFILSWIKIQHYQKSSVEDVNDSDVYYFNMHKGKLYYMYKHFNIFKRNFIRSLFIFGMIIRLLVLPFRKNKSAYTYRQVINILNIYFNK